MGYYSNVMITVTSRDFKQIQKDQEQIGESELLEIADIEEYNKNGQDCIYIKWESIRYTKRFEAIEQLEKSLINSKDGYVFFRLGEKETDIEFRNTAKIEELKEKFYFLENVNKQLKSIFDNEKEEEAEA